MCHTYFTARGWHPPPVVYPCHELLSQFEEIGVRPRDVEHVILTHMHADHTGNVRLFRHARISVQRQEHVFAFGDNLPTAWFATDYNFPDLRWDIVEGDWEVLPGLSVVSTRGHTPGHQSVVVTLPKSGTIILVGDAGDLWENFEQEILPGESVDDEAALASIRQLKRIARESNGKLFLGHDPNFVQQIKLAPEFYE